MSENEIPGTLWQQDDATENPITSLDTTGYGRRVCFRNRTDQTLILCWVDPNGNPHHFYALEPCQRSLRGSRASAIIDATDHTERSKEGHAFLVACATDVRTVQQTKSLEHATIIGGYRPEDNKNLKDEQLDDESVVHLVEIFDTAHYRKPGNVFQRLGCCWPKDQSSTNNNNNPFILQLRLALLDKTPIDTSKKPYTSLHLGEIQWPVHLEPGSLSDERLQMLAADIDAMARRLPPHAVAALRDSTPIWINQSLQYGPATCPITAQGMCFHPGKDWLRRNGMNVEKCECVELYCTESYWTDRALWGTGGLLLHEFSHAYHHKCCSKGYENAEIRQCYQAAIDSGLYDCVEVKKLFGEQTQCTTARAYACTDPMEYFAELSTAFLGGDAKEDYNKWFPFNREQIKEHDPRAYALLQDMWKVSAEAMPLDGESKSMS